MHAVSQSVISIWTLSDGGFHDIESSALDGDTDHLSKSLGVEAFCEHSVDHAFKSLFWNFSL